LVAELSDLRYSSARSWKFPCARSRCHFMGA
jgi:hypothetical protein